MMVKYTVYPNAPITEALIDIRAQLPKDINLEVLEKFHDQIKDRYPGKENRISVQIKAELQFSKKPPPPPIPSPIKPDGFLFRSDTEKKVVQARLDGFTFNKLRPYENWKLFVSEARDLWEAYCQLARPLRVKRIALRYINRIEIPLPIDGFSDYILFLPQIPDGIPPELDHFFMQVKIPNDVQQCMAILTETIEQPTPNNILPLILDIDVSKETIFEISDPIIWEEFEKLRDFKNDIFFNCITDKAGALFK